VSDNEWPKGADMLDRFALKARLNQEVARTRRHGGFLSVAAIGFARAESTPDAHERIEQVAEVLRSGLRIHDVVGWRGWATIVILMPDTDMGQALQGADRLLSLVTAAGALPAARPLAAGVATGYGEIEGGAQALLDAAEHALSEAEPGRIRPSDLLKGQPKVLVIDDDWTLALFLAETISELGWEGNPCTDARDALERVREASYSALFVDLLMPGKGGVDILRESLAHHPSRPCVLMSGMDAENERVMEALALGPVMFIKKPVSKKDLDTALRMFRSRLPGLGSADTV
jgi:PleD family two-component response regulator